MQIDLNADLGEGAGSDEALLALVSSANIACGWHAGDAKTMQQCVRWAIRHSVAIGAHPDSVLYDAGRDRAYVPAGGDGTLTVIDTSSVPRAIGTVLTQKSARTGAVDPATGNVYLPAARYAPAVGTARPQSEPGSFEVLVVSK